MEQEQGRFYGDCERCFGLCCIALPFAKSADFSMNKASGEPCRNLQGDYRCGIHTQLRDRGLRGCTVYDCHGAGQYLSQVTFGGRSPLAHPEEAAQMYALLPVMQQLHEMLLYLGQALTLPAAAELERELREALAETEARTQLSVEALLALDVAAHRASVGQLLRRVSVRVRSAALQASAGSGGGALRAGSAGGSSRAESVDGAGRERSADGEQRGGSADGARRQAAGNRPGTDDAGKRGRDAGRERMSGRGQATEHGSSGSRRQVAEHGNSNGRHRRQAGRALSGDYIGASLRGADLLGADLRGAFMIAADLRDADLRSADLLGADLRDADLRGADLRDSLFLTRLQVRSAKGDARTRLPAGLERPEHWSGA
ncbi:hypothetical protein PA598K_03478 [Paenibacillus sp. 598K]|uniref:pentapeptide repeat-containing protein n=1 Tax=Paenibacillus sp. 598K TaxID=1117987 RepID=UPI000FF9F7F6|nr:pentapeptide repeat-containing protein [Paenibacillus sp. 598K]GBF75095.1 hypothetical protein PA598K_03478 [Paenibacillus sp. 598K]